MCSFFLKRNYCLHVQIKVLRIAEEYIKVSQRSSKTDFKSNQHQNTTLGNVFHPQCTVKVKLAYQDLLKKKKNEVQTLSQLSLQSQHHKGFT